MKRIRFIMLFLLLAATFAVQAGTQFVPKEYIYEAVGSDASKTIYVYFYDLFEYPDNIANKTDISSMEGITISTSSGDNSIIKLSAINAHMSNTRLQLTRMGQVKGETTFTVSITYNGETVTNTFPVKVRGLETSMIKSYLNPDLIAPEKFDVIGNTSFYKSGEKTACSLTIDNTDELKHGTAELVDGENGYKVIQYTPNGNSQQIVSDVIKYTITLSDGIESASNKIITYSTRNCYATKILEYQPAAGQFRSENAWDNPIEFFSSNERGVSLGALGGYIVFGFDQSIYNNPQNPYGVDFTVEGNSFVAAEKGVWTEPGAVQVMEDLNGDGIPNDGEWYELAGSDYWLSTTKHNVELTYYNPHYNVRYTVPWAMKWEENGETKHEYGAVITNNFHKHSFYPDYFYNQDNPDASKRWFLPSISRDSVTFSGVTNIRGCIDMRSPSYIEFYSYSGFGYCDNKGFVKDDSRIAQNPYGRPTLGETAGDGMDISWAVDKDGNYVDLEKIDFVKVYTAGQVIAGWLGEWSTEVLNCAITLPDPEYVPQDYYYNYVGITQLQVAKGHTCQYEGFLFKNGRVIKDAPQRWWLSLDKEGLITDGTDAIAEIDNNGLLTANGYGSVWVHFSAMDNIPEETFEVAVCNLTSVVINLEGNEGVESEALSCIVGERVYINVESEDDNTQNVNETKSNRFIYDTYTWINSNPEVGTIDKGNFIALAPGVTILTAVSGINPALSDQITITVLEKPEVKATPLQIAANNPTGELLNSDIFSTGNGATVYMDEVTALKGVANISLYNNHLHYEFTEGEYVTDILRFKVTCYGSESYIDVPITYGPYNLGSNKQLIVSYTDVDNQIVLAGVDAETLASKDYATTQASTPIDNIVTDGAYAYVTQNAALTRYDANWGKVVATTNLSSDLNHDIAIYADKVIVSDSIYLKVYYKTDLEHFKTIALDKNISKIALNGDVAYILTSDEDNAEMHTLNLTTWTWSNQNIALQSGVNAAEMFYNNGNVYIPTGATATTAADVVIFNTSNNTSSVVVSPIQSASDSKNIATMAGNTIMISTDNGFVPFNISNKTFGNEVVMTNAEMPVAILGESTDSERYYVSYANTGVSIYESADLATAIETTDVAPYAMCLMSAVTQNEAPTVKKAYSYTSGVYERATSVKSCSALSLKNYFNDTEGNDAANITMYIREDVDWLESTYASDGKLTPKVKFTGDVDQATDFTFTLECIDKYGASAMTTATIRITPRIYRPEIADVSIEIETTENNPTATIAIADIFNYTNSTTNLTFKTEITDISDRVLITDATIANNNLNVTVSDVMPGEGYIELAQTITHKTYGSKTFTTTIPVKVIDNTVTGVENISATDKNIKYEGQSLIVENCANEMIAVYDIAGTLITTFEATRDVFEKVLNLQSGIYIVIAKDHAQKISVK